MYSVVLHKFDVQEIDILLDKAKYLLKKKYFQQIPDVYGNISFEPSLRNANQHISGTESILITKKIKELVLNYTAKNQLSNSVGVFCSHYLWYGVGGIFPPHTDNLIKEYPANKIVRYDHSVSKRLVSTLLYLNQDYIGGDIEFPEINFRHVPKSGDLLIFYSGLLHQVHAITDGNRYVFRQFWG